MYGNMKRQCSWTNRKVCIWHFFRSNTHTLSFKLRIINFRQIYCVVIYIHNKVAYWTQSNQVFPRMNTQYLTIYLWENTIYYAFESTKCCSPIEIILNEDDLRKISCGYNTWFFKSFFDIDGFVCLERLSYHS